MGWADDWDVGPIQGPNALRESQCTEPCHHLQGVMDTEHSVTLNILEGTADLQNGLSGNDLAHVEQVSEVPEAGGCGQLQQCKDQSGVRTKGQAHADVLLIQVGSELLKHVPDDGPCHVEFIPPLLVIPGWLNDEQPPVLADVAGTGTAELAAQEGDGGSSGGIVKPLIGVHGSSSCTEVAVALSK
ncbi:hypothetical protein Y1Q_0019146 [Alligator mississippiensis]|uniref:Uncharacterized protein n=1 Tax=Alligator mississippiensis TaxID=8496 RepID=A0A151MQ55_ALLMI|nr:hypothetical protein Y1Q_0019146 [Alligator mississippiensis]